MITRFGAVVAAIPVAFRAKEKAALWDWRKYIAEELGT